MDTQVILTILSLASSVGTAAFFIIRWILQSSTDTTNFTRGQVVTKQEWLAREKELKEERRQDKEEIKNLQKELDEKNDLVLSQAREIIELKDEVRELRHKVKNIEQTQTTNKELQDDLQSSKAVDLKKINT